MCGLLAWFEPAFVLDPAVFMRALDRLGSRGPDGQHADYFLNGRLGLGHARLAIVDPQAGSQPFYSPDGLSAAVVNGEIYQREPLYARLKAAGLTLKTQCDSELIPALYQLMGLDFLEHLVGEFAFVLYDQKRQLLIAARDRFGVKPLCWWKNELGGIRFASKAAALFESGVAAQWDADSLRQVYALQYVLPHKTLFKNIRSVAPGTAVVFDLSEFSVKTHAYWQIPYTPREHFEAGPDTASFSEQLAVCISDRAKTDVKACGHLSGGIDSSTVAYFSNKEHAGFTGFGLSFPDSGYFDEYPLAAEFAQSQNLPLERVALRPSDIASVFKKAVKATEGCAINGHLSAKYILNQRIQDLGFRVALTGEGADELLYGYSHFRADLKLTDTSGQHQRQQGMHLPVGQPFAMQTLSQTLGFVPHFLQAKACQGSRVMELMSAPNAADFAQASAHLLPLIYKHPQLKTTQSHLPVQVSHWLWCQLALNGYILQTLGDGCEMAHGIEGRPPFLDHRLFELLKNVHPAQHFHAAAGSAHHTEKKYLRQAMGGRLPDSLCQRAKQPLSAPPLSQSNVWQQFLHNSFCVTELPPGISKQKIQQLLTRLPSLSQAEHLQWDPVLHLVLSLAFLQEEFSLS